MEVKRLSELKNIGVEIEKQLSQVGIASFNDLMEVGSMEAWLKIKGIDPSACINRLMALEGAIQGVRWHDLSESDKERLKMFYRQNK